MSLIAAPLSAEYRIPPVPAVFRYLTSALNRLSDRYWEAYFNINTRQNAPSPHADANRYGFLAYHTYFAILDRLNLQPSAVVADLGCGKGRVSCLAAHYRIRASVGVEIDPPLWALAQANAARMKHRRSPLSFVNKSAARFDYDEVTVAIMFHPFGAETMRAMLERVQESLLRRPRTFRIVYLNPVLSPMLAAKPFLQVYECWQPTAWTRLKFPVHFYRNV